VKLVSVVNCIAGPTQVQIPNGIGIGSSVFAHFTSESHYNLPLAAPFLPP